MSIEETKDDDERVDVKTPILSVDESLTTEQRLTDNVTENILPARYLKRDDSGEVIESVDEMFERVADKVAEAEYVWGDEDDFTNWKDAFYTVMTEQRAMPNSPALMNMGNILNQGSACFVCSPNDSMESIFDSAKDWGLIQKTGGGIGGGFHHLRPKGAIVSSTKGKSSGPVSFMHLFNQVAGTVKQGGTRRGAQMAILRVDHADVGRFAVAKREEGVLSNFNISVAVTNEFIEAVQEDAEYTFYDPQTDFDEGQSVLDETEYFYSPAYADSPEGLVDENIWRDYGENILCHDDDDSLVTLNEKWKDDERVDIREGETLTLPAQFVFDIMVDGAWRNGEPGFVHYDEMNDEHSFDVEEYPEHRIDSTNPSLAGDTEVLTDDGIYEIEELEDTSFKVLTTDDEWAPARCWKSGSDETVYRVNLSNGTSYIATPEHDWPVQPNADVTNRENVSLEKYQTTELQPGDYIPSYKTDTLQYGDEGSYDDGLLIGWLYGDGSVTERVIENKTKENTTYNQYGFTFSAEDKDAGVMEPVVQKLKNVADYDYKPTKRQRDGKPWFEIHAGNKNINEYMDRFGVGNKKNGLPDDAYSEWSEEMRKGFIDGLFSADAYVDSTQSRITFTTAHEKMKEDISNILSFYGIKHHAEKSTTNHESNDAFLSDEYERFDITISKKNSNLFNDIFELTHSKKSSELSEIDECVRDNVLANHVTVESVTEVDEKMDVWDIAVYDDTHTFRISDCFTGNCSEQPLSEYESCNLMHINLSLLVEDGSQTFDEYTSLTDHDYETTQAAARDYFNHAVDTEELERVTQTIVRFLDNMIEVSEFPLEEIDDRVKGMRKIGVGLMGWAQMLAQMGIRYGSDESIELGRILMANVDAIATEYSHELAVERGSFDYWDESKYASPTEYPDWFEQHAHQLPQEWPDGYPVRNHNHTTVAPTGCVKENSLISTSDGLQKIGEMGNATEIEKWDDIDETVMTDDGPKQATQFYNAGFTNVQTIADSHGREITATPDHRLRTVSDDGEIVWQTVSEFEEGDVIVSQRGTFADTDNVRLDTSERDEFIHNTDDELVLPDTMTEELAEFLGYWTGDGYIHDGVGVKLALERGKIELKEHLIELGESVFGVTPTIETRESVETLCFGGRHLPRYFHDNGWTKESGNEGEGSASVQIPDDILQSSESVARAYLRGLFEADGCASRKIELSTVSEELSKQVQTLLLSLGHVFQRDSLCSEKLGDEHFGDRTRYTLAGANKYQDKLFCDDIGFITKETEFAITKQSHKNDCVPASVVNGDGFTRSQSTEFDWSVAMRRIRNTSTHDNLEQYVFATVSEKGEDVAYTADLTVPANNTYTANGFISHNTTSLIADTSGGIEPVYNVAYKKNVGDDIQGDTKLVEFDDLFLATLEENGVDVDAVKKQAAEQMDRNDFEGVSGLDIPRDIKDIFVTTNDVSPEEHVNMQRAFQEFTDSGLSKTLNMPSDATRSDVKTAYMNALKDEGVGKPAKGTTVYVDESREEQVLMTNEYTSKELENAREKLEAVGYTVEEPDE